MGVQEETFFGIIIPDAFGFRALIEFLNHAGFRIITLYVTSEAIYIKERNEDMNIDIDVEFDLLRLNSSYEAPVKSYKVGLDTGRLATELKMATVKTALQITKEKGDDYLTFSSYGQNISGDPTNTVIIDPVEPTTLKGKWKLNELHADELLCNAFISALDFSKLCAGYKEKKKTRDQKILPVRITGYHGGFAFSASSPSGCAPRISSRGDTSNETKILSYTVPQALVKSLGEIHKFNKQNGIVSLFFEENKPIKIMIPVSNFALIRLYVNNYEEKDD